VTRARLLFDRTEGSTPFDRDGVLTAWSVPAQATDGAPVPEEGARWPARRWTAVEGYDASDPDSLFAGHIGLTVRLQLVPDWTYLDTEVALVNRGEGGPANSQARAWSFTAYFRATELELFYTYQLTAAAAPVVVALGSVGRRPDGASYWLTFALDGTSATAWESGQPVASAVIPRPAFTSDVQLHIGHQIQHDDPVSQLPLRGLVELVEILDTASTSVAEQIRYRGLQAATASVFQDWRQFYYQDDTYLRRRLRPIEDSVGAIEERALELEIAHSPPVVAGELLVAWEQALGLVPASDATLAERQQAVSEAALAPDGFTPSAIQAYAALLFQEPPGAIAIIERNAWMTIPTTGADIEPEQWSFERAVLQRAGGLELRHPAGEIVNLGLPTFAYLGIDHDPGRGLLEHGLMATIEVTNSAPEHAAAMFLAETWPPDFWVTVDSDGVSIVDAAGSTTLVRTLTGTTATLILWWTDGSWQLTARETSTDDVVTTIPDGRSLRLGFGFLGDGTTVPGADLVALVSDVEFLDAASGIGSLAHAYHPGPTVRRCVQHTDLLTSRSRATSLVTATYSLDFLTDDSDSQLDCTPLAF